MLSDYRIVSLRIRNIEDEDIDASQAHFVRHVQIHTINASF